ncbi:MAG: MFS transporter [Streptosporangiales bacterium]|nr:MFS transporter [Streptosporangiales bacterium]
MNVENPTNRPSAGQQTSTGVSRSDRRNGFIAAWFGWCLDGFETYVAVLVGQQVVAGLVGPDASALYFAGILAVTLVAWAVGGMVSGVLADYFGRRRVLMFSIIWYAAFTGLTALAPNYWFFIAFRFLTGLGMGAEWAPGAALVSEMWKDKSRGRGIAFLQGGFGVGFLLATAVWIFVQGGPGSWRYMFLIGVLPAVLVLFIRRYVRDPKLWTDADDARRAARKRRREGTELSDADKALTRFTVAHLFHEPILRRRILILLVLATTTLGGWWAVSTWVPQFGAAMAAENGLDPVATATSTAFWYNVGGIIGYFSMGFLNDFFGRRPTMFAYFIGALVMNVVLFMFATPATLFIAAAANGVFTLGLFTWMATWPVELFPTHVRGTAITIVFNSTRIIVAAATMVSGLLVNAFGAVSTAALVIGMIYILGLVFTFLAGPETKGKPLPS